jgi:regulator of RNase E activity RraB
MLAVTNVGTEGMVGIFDRLRGKNLDPGDKIVIDQMRRAGQKLDSVPRPTEHHLLFESEATATAAARAARDLGYAVTVDHEEAEWEVSATHTIIVNEKAITAARRQLTGVAEQNGGDYDGWDALSDSAVEGSQPDQPFKAAG